MSFLYTGDVDGDGYGEVEVVVGKGDGSGVMRMNSWVSCVMIHSNPFMCTFVFCYFQILLCVHLFLYMR